MAGYGRSRRPMSGELSSGSELEGLSGLVQAFFECDDSASPSGVDDAAATAGAEYDGRELAGATAVADAAATAAAAAAGDLLRGLTKGDGFRLLLLSDASTAAEALSALRANGSAYRRAVMARLREMGYDAGICKARWEKSDGVIAGSYEYIDVVATAAAAAEGRRYIMDLGFAAEFVVARATPEYEQLVAALPELMVARPVEVREAVQLVGEAARRSLKAQGLHVPPWRRGRYMMAKWLGPYRRTVNAISASAGVPVVGSGDANCRGMGFAAEGIIFESMYRLR